MSHAPTKISNQLLQTPKASSYHVLVCWKQWYSDEVRAVPTSQLSILWDHRCAVLSRHGRINWKQSSHTLVGDVYWKELASNVPSKSPYYCWNTPRFGNHSSTVLHFGYWYADYTKTKSLLNGNGTNFCPKYSQQQTHRW